MSVNLSDKEPSVEEPLRCAVSSVFGLTSILCVPASPQEISLGAGLKDQQVLGIWGQCQLFQHSVETLYSQLQDKGEGAELTWDKVIFLMSVCSSVSDN